MLEFKKRMDVESDLSFTSFFHAIDQFRDAFNFVPNKIVVDLSNIDTAKVILKQIAPQDYGNLKDKIDLNFEFTMDENFPRYYWQLEGIKESIKYILYTNGA